MMVISVSITRGVIATVASTSPEHCPFLTLSSFEPNRWNNPASARATWQYTFFSFFLSLDLEDEVVADVLASMGVAGSGSGVVISQGAVREGGNGAHDCDGGVHVPRGGGQEAVELPWQCLRPQDAMESTVRVKRGSAAT
jgi:hypothetical protein